MLKIRKGDIVASTKGRDRGKKGKVIEILPGGQRALVEGINMVKKHKRKTQQDQQGGIVSIESSISVSNIALVCKNCNKSARIGFTTLTDGTKARICKLCKEAVG